MRVYGAVQQTEGQSEDLSTSYPQGIDLIARLAGVPTIAEILTISFDASILTRPSLASTPHPFYMDLLHGTYL
jgi:hypothetical protein